MREGVEIQRQLLPILVARARVAGLSVRYERGAQGKDLQPAIGVLGDVASLSCTDSAWKYAIARERGDDASYFAPTSFVCRLFVLNCKRGGRAMSSSLTTGDVPPMSTGLHFDDNPANLESGDAPTPLNCLASNSTYWTLLFGLREQTRHNKMYTLKHVFVQESTRSFYYYDTLISMGTGSPYFPRIRPGSYHLPRQVVDC